MAHACARSRDRSPRGSLSFCHAFGQRGTTPLGPDCALFAHRGGHEQPEPELARSRLHGLQRRRRTSGKRIQRLGLGACRDGPRRYQCGLRRQAFDGPWAGGSSAVFAGWQPRGLRRAAAACFTLVGLANCPQHVLRSGLSPRNHQHFGRYTFLCAFIGARPMAV